MSNRKKSIYIVLRSRQPGIYTQWDGPEGARIQVDGFSGAIYKGFYTSEEAINWLKPHLNQSLPAPLQKWLAEQEKALNNAEAPSLESRIENHLLKGGTVIFTDGSALGNPGPGGYAAVIYQKDRARREISGGFRFTTNNRMELYACIAALESLTPPEQVILITDSEYVSRATTEGWLQRWANNGWKRHDRKAVENQDLWQRLYHLCQMLSVEFLWIKGHNATIENERCDRLANSVAQQPNLPEDLGYRRYHPISKDRLA